MKMVGRTKLETAANSTRFVYKVPNFRREPSWKR